MDKVSKLTNKLEALGYSFNQSLVLIKKGISEERERQASSLLSDALHNASPQELEELAAQCKESNVSKGLRREESEVDDA